MVFVKLCKRSTVVSSVLVNQLEVHQIFNSESESDATQNLIPKVKMAMVNRKRSPWPSSARANLTAVCIQNALTKTAEKDNGLSQLICTVSLLTLFTKWHTCSLISYGFSPQFGPLPVPTHWPPAAEFRLVSISLGRYMATGTSASISLIRLQPHHMTQSL